MNAEQRFCPVCNQAFAPAEAVLRCRGCGVLHHPTCWVRNEGCATDRVHAESAEPLAYEPQQPPIVPEPHPGEGTRLRRPPGPGETPVIGSEPDALPPEVEIPQPLARRRAEATGEAADLPPDHSDDDWSEPSEGEVGAAEESEDGEAPRHQAPVPEAPRRVRYGRYEPLETVPVRRPLPSIYRRHRILGLWYIPAALLLGAAVAVSVVLGADYLAGDGGDDPAALPSPTVPPATGTVSSGAGSATPAPPATPHPTNTPSTPVATATPSITPLPGQFLFGPGDRVVVVGTGDCLNVRDAPSTRGPVVSCVGDGIEATILSGPAEGDGYQWWYVRAQGYAEGWVVEDYLGRAQ